MKKLLKREHHLQADGVEIMYYMGSPPVLGYGKQKNKNEKK